MSIRAKPLLKLVHNDTANHQLHESAQSLNSVVSVLREVGLVLVQEKTSQEEVEAAGDEEKNAEDAVHGGVGVGVEVGQAGQGKAGNDSHVEGGLAFACWGNAIEFWVNSPDFALEDWETEEGDDEHPEAVDEGLCDDVTDGGHHWNCLFPVALSGVMIALPLKDG